MKSYLLTCEKTDSVLESVTFIHPDDIMWIVIFPNDLDKDEINKRIELYKNRASASIILFSWNGILRIHVLKEAWYAWVLKDSLEEYVNRKNRVSHVV